MDIIVEKLQNPFVYALGFILLITYIGRILSAIFKVLKINSCINTLALFVNSATQSYMGPIDKKADYNDNALKVLRKYPDMSEFTNFYSPELSYEDSIDITYCNSVKLLREFFMKRNYLVKNLKETLNPISTIKVVLSLPGSLLHWIGFKPTSIFEKFFDIIIWVSTYFLGIYSEEIKTFITSLLTTVQHIGK